MYSVICFIYQKKEYVGASGDGDFFEVFDVSKLDEKDFLSRDYVLWIDLLFLKK